MSVNYNPATPTDGLVLCLDTGNRRSYPGSGNTWFDISGQNNHGTLTNGAALNTGFGGGISFDGVDDSVITTYTGSLTTAFSAFAWWRRTTGGSQKSVIAKYQTTTNERSWMLCTAGTNWTSGGSPTGQELGAIVSGNGTFNSNDLKAGWTNRNISDGQWYHVGFVWNNGNIQLYINGVSQTVIPQFSGSSTSVKTSSVPVSIGSINPLGGASTNFFDGWIEDARVYNRALSQPEIYQLFSSKRGRFGV